MIESNPIKLNDFFEKIDDYETELFIKDNNSDLSERDQILVEEVIEKNLPTIKKNIELFSNKSKSKKFLESEYGRAAYFGEMSFEEASEKFEQTQEAQDINLEYQDTAITKMTALYY
jgi:hypothetical protein